MKKAELIKIIAKLLKTDVDSSFIQELDDNQLENFSSLHPG
ncbi:MAG: hypothetical protein ABRQ29_05840 [Smithellaceae bacterium]